VSGRECLDGGTFYIDIAGPELAGPSRLGGIRNGYDPTGGRILGIVPEARLGPIRPPDIPPCTIPCRLMIPIGASGASVPEGRPRLEAPRDSPILIPVGLATTPLVRDITPNPWPGPGE
jgi:hypothetical protein